MERTTTRPGMIYYSHVNEDNQAERLTLGKYPYDRLLCIAGSGERVIALLDAPGLKTVDVVDVNPEALYLTELKIAALKTLEIDQYLGLTGFYPMDAGSRMHCFHTCKSQLDDATRTYWENRGDWLTSGLLYTGHFEKFLTRVRPFVNLLAGKGFERAFRGDVSDFPARRWELLKHIFSNKLILRLFGNRDEAFTGKNCRPERIGKGIQRLLDENDLGRSFMANLIFKGHLRDMAPADLPPSLQTTVLLGIQEIIQSDRVHINFFRGDFLDHFRSHAYSFKKERIFCSLSDLLSFETPDYLIRLISEAGNYSPEKITFVIRSFLRNDLEPGDLQKIRNKKFRVTDISCLDKTAMYKVHKIEKGHDRF